jgi:large subunit ribosomal protein L18
MKTALEKRERRKKSVRRRLAARGPQTRLAIHRSSKHIYAQVIEPSGRAVCAVSSTKKAFVSELAEKTKTEQAAFVGKEIARLARERGIERVVFDRGRCRFHGRVKALADAAREGGLKF